MKRLFFDIETTGFNRQKDKIIIFSSSELYSHEIDSIQCYKMTEEDALMAILDRISCFSHIVTWGGAAFDIPFIEYKAKSLGIKTKLPGHTDLMMYFRKNFPGMPYSLSDVSKSLITKSIKTDFDESIWSSASSGEEDAYKHIEKHCVNDVLIVKEIWRKVMV